MPTPVTVPRLGWNMEEGTFLEWLKADGEAVRPGDALFRLEGDKAAEDVESLDGGTLHVPADGPKPGDRVAVGAVIGYLLAAGETAPARDATASRAASAAGCDAATRGLTARGSPSSAPVADAPGSPKSPVTPRARRLAARLGVDCAAVRGSGRGGRVRERDVAAATVGVVPHTPVRRITAARMVESRQSTVPVTLTTEVDATHLVALRRRFPADGGPAPSVTDLFVKLAAFALREHPTLAARWADAGLVPAARLDVGFAVDTDAGLLVPVVRDVPALGLRDLAARTRDLIERARAGTLPAAELRGGCFTVTNLGAFGIDAFTPVINPPECAVLGVGRIARRPAADGDRLVVRDTVVLSLTFDHRIVDGAPAARFLQTIARGVEHAQTWSEP